MIRKRANMVMALLVLCAFGLGIILYPSLPLEMVSRWDFNGTARSMTPKVWGVFLLPCIMACMFALSWILPRLDPLRENIAASRGAYNGFFCSIIAFLLYVFILNLLWNLGWQKVPIGQALTPAIALLLFGIGVLLPKTKRNWFVGIRTPWTLSSDEVWRSTHHLGGLLFKIAAAISLISLFFPSLFLVVSIFPLLIIALVLIVYSYFQYRRLPI